VQTATLRRQSTAAHSTRLSCAAQEMSVRPVEAILFSLLKRRGNRVKRTWRTPIGNSNNPIDGCECLRINQHCLEKERAKTKRAL
jgi:hypothetical protein